MSKFLRKSSLFWMLLLGAILVTPVAKAGDQYGYNEGFFLSSADDDFMLKMNYHFVGRYTGQVFDGATANTSGFSVPFSRIYFSGHAFGPAWTYNLSFEMATGALAARDYYVSWMHCEKMNLMVGQFKVPYGFEFLVPDYHQQFANASIVTTSGAIPGREIGLGMHGALADKKVMYWLAVTNGLANGTGINASQPANDIDFRYTGRLTYNAMGNHGFWYSDMGKSEEAQMALSIGGNWNRIDTDSDLTYDNTYGFTVDAQYAMGGMSAAAEYHMLYQEFSAGSTETTDQAVSGQVGFFMNDNAELAVRVGWLEPDAGGRTVQPSAVLNWYLHGHNAKVQVQYDLSFRQDVPVGATTDDFTDHQGVVQLQFFI